jgi:hypothetical protein
MSRALLLAVMAATGASPAVAAGSSNAVPLFARQTGLTCAQCHVLYGAPVPSFTFTGKKFRMNGYRMPWVSQKIEAGEPGAINGRRLDINLVPYLSFRYQSVFAAQSKAPGAADKGPITSNPTSRLAIFSGGAFGDNFGLWTEFYLTPPNDNPGGEWGIGNFTFDEYDLRYVKTVGDNNTIGLGFSNQGVSEISGFGPWSPGGSMITTGGIAGWAHPNRGQLFGYGWLRDQLFFSLGAQPGMDNLNWYKSSIIGNVAFAPFHEDQKEAWVNVEFSLGNDNIPLLTNRSSITNNTSWNTTDAVNGVSATHGGAPYAARDIKTTRRLTGELLYGFVDHGPHSLNLGASYNINKDNYLNTATAEVNSVFGRLRYVYERTWGLDLQVGKNTTYKYTDGTGAAHTIPNKLSYNMYGTFQPAMNVLIALNYGRQQTFTLDNPALTGWSWNLNIDYLF